jgi:hypothetical protein
LLARLGSHLSVGGQALEEAHSGEIIFPLTNHAMPSSDCHAHLWQVFHAEWVLRAVEARFPIAMHKYVLGGVAVAIPRVLFDRWMRVYSYRPH